MIDSAGPVPALDRRGPDIDSVFILALGVIAALNQIGVATTVVTPS
nr:hypothetical protein [Micromonospora coxensis]